MMVMVDNNFLIELLDNKETYLMYNQYMERGSITLGLPTPVLAEFLVKDENYNRTDFLNKVNPFLQIFDFDQKSAHISANIFRDLLTMGYFIKKGREQRQVIKVDIQILATTVANGINQLFTSDTGIMEIVELLDELPVCIVDFLHDEMKGLDLFHTDR